ncbi:MAG: non-heme iron oxygenase ferredoxin subunit [Verrucomicrobiota bacterium]
MSSSRFKAITESNTLLEGQCLPVTLEGHPIALIRHDGSIYALEDRCPHADATIAMGLIDNGCIACPWHFAEFNLATGAVLSGPATEGIPTYPVHEENGMVYVALNPKMPGNDPD